MHVGPISDSSRSQPWDYALGETLDIESRPNARESPNRRKLIQFKHHASLSPISNAFAEFARGGQVTIYFQMNPSFHVQLPFELLFFGVLPVPAVVLFSDFSQRR